MNMAGEHWIGAPRTAVGQARHDEAILPHRVLRFRLLDQALIAVQATTCVAHFVRAPRPFAGLASDGGI